MAERGADGFEAYYGALFGERWTELRSVLLAPGTQVAYRTGLTTPYYLDPASVVAALALEPAPGDLVVDLCAAPGGKSLVIAGRMGPDGRLICNERSSARRARLHRVLDAHLPAEVRLRVTVTGFDAATWGVRRPASCDRVLADVPCSSEQHVMASKAALAEWSSSRTRRLAAGAYAIACAAADSVRPGGRIVYSTCALSPVENDAVIERLLERQARRRKPRPEPGALPDSEGERGGLTALDPAPVVARILSAEPGLVAGLGARPTRRAASAAAGSPTGYGWQFMPDTDHGIGPIYLAVLERSGG